MAQFDQGGSISEPIDFVPEPGAYSAPSFAPTIPGADWFIEGHRYREVNRVDTENGYTLTLERADLPPLFESLNPPFEF